MAEKTNGLSAAEKKAVKERAKELRAEQKKDKLRADMLAKIDEMPPEDQTIAHAVREIVEEVAPHLTAKTFYGMPAWADDAGKVVLSFQAAAKFEARYCTLAFDEAAQLDEGTMWPTAWAITELTDAGREQIRDLVRRAAGTG